MEKLTREEAIERGLSFFFSGEPCKNGHVAKRSVISGTCAECVKIAASGTRRKRREALEAAREKLAEQS